MTVYKSNHHITHSPVCSLHATSELLENVWFILTGPRTAIKTRAVVSIYSVLQSSFEDHTAWRQFGSLEDCKFTPKII